MKEISLMFDGSSVEPLVGRYGQVNVEEALIYLTKATDPKGLSVHIPATKERVEKILEAVHGEFLDEE